MVNYEYTRDPARAAVIAQSLMHEQLIGVDTETTGLDCHGDKVILLSASTKEKTYLIDTRDVRCLEPFKGPLESREITKVGVNLQFDWCMLMGTANIEMDNVCDLFLGERCLTSGIQKDGRSLEAITLKYLNKQRDKSLQKSFINHKGDLTQSQLDYAAEDTADLLLLGKLMHEQIKKEGLKFTWNLENKVLPCFGEIHYFGQKLDTRLWKQNMSDNEAALVLARKDLDVYFEQVYSRNLFGELDINYDSVPTVLHGLKMLGVLVDGKTIQDTSKKTQKKIRDLPIMQALERHRKAAKALSEYGQKYLDAIHKKTGKIHPSLLQYGTDTGRPAGRSGLNVLNIPREKRYRHAFIADDDRMISTVDYSGAELRILADLSGDPLMIQGFCSGVDFHCYVASMLFGKEVTKKNENAHLRQPTKAINFGLCYGLGADSLHEQLNGEGYKIRLEDCRELFRKYKSTFKGAIQQLQDWQSEAKRNLVMRNATGRMRRWIPPNETAIYRKLETEFQKRRKLTDEAQRELEKDTEEAYQGQWAAVAREGANFKVQSTNVEMTKSAMVVMRDTFKAKQYDVKMYNTVYDETVLDTPKSCAQDVYDLQCKIMIEEGQRFIKKVPVEVEGHLKPHWEK